MLLTLQFYLTSVRLLVEDLLFRALIGSFPSWPEIASVSDNPRVLLLLLLTCALWHCTMCSAPVELSGIVRSYLHHTSAHLLYNLNKSPITWYTN